jgi:hypothetical protein
MTIRGDMPSQLGPFKIAGWDWLSNYFPQKWENLVGALVEKIRARARQHGAGGQSPIVERVSLETKVRGQEQKVFLSFWVCADPSDPTKAVLIFWEGERDASY